MSFDHSNGKYLTAIDIFVGEQFVSISLLQRRMKIGYTLALEIVKYLEALGVVTEKNFMGDRMLTEQYSSSGQAFRRWALGYSGCDGGDIGSAMKKSKWVCGIEWGGGHDPQSLLERIQDDVSVPPGGYEKWEENISYIFNWQIMKLFFSC